MLRSWFWAVAISTTLATLYSIHSVRAAVSAQGGGTTAVGEAGRAAPAVQLAAGRGGGGGGGRGGGGGGRGFGGGGRSFGGGGGFGSGGGMRAVTPGVAGSRFGTAGVASPELATPGTTGSRFATPQGPATVRPGIVPGIPRVYARHGGHGSGANYPRYRHRRRGYAYYYGGWWYAYPWWTENGPYYYGGDCGYLSNVCASQWGYDTDGYYSCMSYYGCD